MDWQKNRIWVGGVVLLVLVAVTIWAVRSEDQDVEPEAREAQLEGLLPEVDSATLDELEIHRPDSPVVRLAKGSAGWALVAPIEADADQSVVRTALDKLGEMEVDRVAATNPANHEHLEVTEEKGIRVIARSGGTVVVNLIIGTYGHGATMVRQDEDDRVMAVHGSIKFAFNKEVKDWRNRRVTDVGPGDVVAIAFHDHDGDWRFERGDDDEWKQAAGETEIERFGSAKVQSIVASLARMRAVNFADPETTLDSAGLGEDAATVTMTVRHVAEAESSHDEHGDEHGDEAAGDEPAAGDEAAGDEPAAVTSETIVLRLGNSTEGDREFHLVREGDDTIFRVSSFLADKIRVNTESFQTPEPGSEPPAPPTPPSGGGLPPGLGGAGMPPGGGQIPPEVMRQIQQQLQKQQAHP